MSFNGGKDCLVVFHLLRLSFAKLNRDFCADIEFVYFEKKDDFKEVREFIRETEAEYNVSVRVMTEAYKEGLTRLHDEDGVDAIFMGQRRGDPHAEHLEVFTKCSDGWPDVVRINPILEWRYKTVWDYLLGLKVKYCRLYDQGYTSLGDVATTVKHPALKKVKSDDADARDGHHPAHLLDHDDERFGRTSK